MSIDLKDVKIVGYLTKNSRMTYSQIGKKVLLSGDSVKNRINKMQNNDIIKSFKLNINYNKLGFLEYDVYLKLKNYTQKELDLIIKFLTCNNFVTWIGTCFGNYDLRISLVIRDNNDLNLFLNEFERNFSNLYVDSKVVYVISKYKISQKKILSNLFSTDINKLEFMKEDTSRGNISSKYTNDISKDAKEYLKLNEIDKSIIMQLNQKINTSLIEISKTINLTPEAIKYRINELEKSGIINSFSVIINGNKLGKIWAVFLFKLSSSNNTDFLNHVKDSSNVSSFVNLLGEWNYSVSVFASDVHEIHNILMSFRNKFPNLIREYELLLLFETYKYPAVPSIVYN